mgnify:CR=1 FL=1
MVILCIQVSDQAIRAFATMQVAQAGKAQIQYQTCVDAPLDASGILGSVGHVIRCGRVSGLEDAACHAPRACMEICRSGPVRLPALDGAPSGMLVRPTGLLTVCPCVPSLPLTSGDNPATLTYAVAIAGSL